MDPATLEGLILREVRRSTEISRRDLSDALGVARSTAGRRVDSLIERGLIRERGIEERTEAGRPRRLLELCGGFGRFVGFDFDARAIYATLVDFAQGTLFEEEISLSPKPTRKEVLKHLRNFIREFSGDNAENPILGYGIGVPGRISQEDRIGISYPYIEDWEQVSLVEELKLSPETLHIENNTKTIALGEYWLGNPFPAEHLVCVNIRTGISSAIISDGHLLRGLHEMAGEIRGWTIHDDTEAGWLEDRGTVRAIIEHADGNPEAWDEFVQACESRAPGALESLDRFVRYHADAISRLVQLADPEVVVVAGAFNELGSIYLKRLQAATAAELADHYFSPPPIRFVARKDHAGAHGAAALAAQAFKPDPTTIIPASAKTSASAKQKRARRTR